MITPVFIASGVGCGFFFGCFVFCLSCLEPYMTFRQHWSKHERQKTKPALFYIVCSVLQTFAILVDKDSPNEPLLLTLQTLPEC